MNFRIAFALMLIGGPIICAAAPGKKAAAKEQKANELTQLFESCFPRWDRNHDGTLSLTELSAPIEDPRVRGDEAAAAVLIRRQFASKDEQADFQGVTRAQLLAFADEPGAVRSFSKIARRVKEVSHALFLPGDPNLHTFHQGGVGDCYLLSTIGALVYRDPQTVRSMFKLLPGGNYEVHFLNGKVVTILPPTDAELVMGAREGSNRGIWLSVLEKAYAAIREEKRSRREGSVAEDDEKIAKDFLGGGSSGPVIALLTGHKAANVLLARRENQDPKGTLEQFRARLTDLTREHRLITVGAGKNPDKQLPKHIAHNHLFGVLNYDATRQMVRVFNPWGNDVTPKGAPGLVNGYVTRDGIFDVPLQEFVQIFGWFTYETAQPANLKVSLLR